MSREAVQRYMLWIDGVGSWLVICGRSIIAGSAVDGSSADIRMMAPLSRRHAEIEQTDEGWVLHVPAAGTAAAVKAAEANVGVGVRSSAVLFSGKVIEFAGRMQMVFRIPNVLSVSAVLIPEVPQRMVPYADGIVLLADRMLIGPRTDAHICCPQLVVQFVLYTQNGRLCCRSAAGFTVNGANVEAMAMLCDGDVIVAGEFRMRIEALSARETDR